MAVAGYCSGNRTHLAAPIHCSGAAAAGSEAALESSIRRAYGLPVYIAHVSCFHEQD